jgi:RHS repeat-associated protein
VDAAGTPIAGAASNDARRTFTGYEDEFLSDLQYAGARFYDPELGQFLTHDPAGQFASPYAYGPGDPVNGTDPTGALFGIDDAVLITLAIVIGVSTAFAAAQAAVFGGNPVKAGLTAAGMGVLGAGLGIAVGAAGAAIGTDSQVMGMLTNPLVQDSLAAASAGLPVAAAASGDDAGMALGIVSAALSLTLAFSAGASSAANGTQAGSAKSHRNRSETSGDLTPEQVSERRAWAQKAKEAIYGLANDPSREVPWPERFDSPTIRISPSPSPESATLKAQIDIGWRSSPLGIDVRTGHITIFPAGSTSYQETFFSVGHEMGHFLFPGHGDAEAWGRELWRIHNQGGAYRGPRP